MFASNQHLAHARYYLAEAATAAPAEADDELYRRMGTMAMSKSQFSTASAAFGVLLAREKATADDLESLAHALQAGQGNTDEAATRTRGPTNSTRPRHELLRKRATLLSQGGEHARAAELFERYIENAAPDEKLRVALEERITMLRARAQAEAPAEEQPRTRPSRTPRRARAS